MSIKPILFNTEMVRAILEGRKTVTRRVMKPQPVFNGHLWELGGAGWSDTITSFTPMPCHSLYNRAPFHEGDILYVRETFTKEGDRYYYRADFESDWLDPCETLSGGYPAACRYRNCDTCCAEGERIRWKPSIHMPKEAARIFLRVKSVRVEQLQAITNEDALKEGFTGIPCNCTNTFIAGGALCCTDCMNTGWQEPPARDFVMLWDSTIKPADLPTYGWDANPWVWVIEFERINKEEAMKC